jgi:phosphoserine phosphatase
MPDGSPVLIFDLDGTVLTINSFPRWAAFMLRGRAVRQPGWRRPWSMAMVALLLAGRKAGLIDHEALKWRLQKLWQDCVRNDGGRTVAQFIATLQPFLQPALRGPLAGVAAGQGDAVLATAAAADYAVPLGRRLGFLHILATDRGQSRSRTSNVREHKRDAVLNLLVELGWQDRRRVLFTDHEDDLPLMAICHPIYWFGDAARERQVRRVLPGIELRAGVLAQSELTDLMPGMADPSMQAA